MSEECVKMILTRVVFKNCPKKQTKNIFFTYYVTLLHKINNQFASN